MGKQKKACKDNCLACEFMNLCHNFLSSPAEELFCKKEKINAMILEIAKINQIGFYTALERAIKATNGPKREIEEKEYTKEKTLALQRMEESGKAAGEARTNKIWERIINGRKT